MTGVRRIVTGHDSNGRAIVQSDGAIPVRPIPSGDARFALLWTTPSVPADNDDATDGGARHVGLATDAGTVLRMVDILPGSLSPMHRTNSVDYGIVLSGTVELILDDDSVTLAHAGDVIVQRGTIHAWRNPDLDTVCRMAFVLVGAKPVTIDGQPLPHIDP